MSEDDDSPVRPRGVYWLPNILTTGALFAGFYAIVAAIDAAQGNIAHAARALGINRSTLYYRLRKHGLEHLLPLKDAAASPPVTDEGAGGTSPPPRPQ